jgi:GNAT superfamily N-acetyltransferase
VHTGKDAPIALEIATPADADAIRSLYTAGGWQPRFRSWQELEERIAQDEVAVLREGGQVVASVTVTWEDEARWGAAGDDGAAGYVHALVRDRTRTAAGLGAQLLAWAESRVAARGRGLSRLDTPAERARLVAYYQAHGYRIVDTRSYPWRPRPLTLFEKRLG